MESEKTETLKIGVVIGRFQVPYLHDGHTYLLNTAAEGADKLLVLIGTVKAQPTRRNPLSFEQRQYMILEKYPDAIVLPLYDNPSHPEWSKQVDRLISKACVDSIKADTEKVEVRVNLVCSRDGFKPYYTGIHKVNEIPPIPAISGTTSRKLLTKKNCFLYEVPTMQSFRSGIIHSVYNHFPTAYFAVDVAPIYINEIPSNGKEWTLKDVFILMGRKPGRQQWQFIGGFVDPTDNSINESVIRELNEETGCTLHVNKIQYLCNAKIDDFRYRWDDDAKVFSLMHLAFVAYMSKPKPSDDIEDADWFNVDKYSLTAYQFILPAHRQFISPILEALKQTINELNIKNRQLQIQPLESNS